MAGKTFIFDLDDTLTRTQHYYDLSRMAFCEYIIRKHRDIAPSKDWIDAKFVKMYSDAVRQNGFSRLERFPEVMVKCYIEICAEFCMNWSQKNANEVYQIGWNAVDPEVYKRKARLLPGARETLDFLLSRQDELIVCTKGPKALQQTKIDALNLEKWAGEFHIVGEKDEAKFRKIVGAREMGSCYSVGDSEKSDINPAIRAGINAIWIPYESWAHEKEAGELKEGKGQLFVFKELLNIKRNYDKL